MTANGPEDMMDAYRKVLTQWETMANEFGAKIMQSPETNQAVHNLTNVNMQFQSQLKEAMQKALHALQVPSRADYEDMSGRINAMEASLARIETMLVALTGSSTAGSSSAPKPARTRKPKDAQ